MFRDVPERSGMFHVPGFIDAPFLKYNIYISKKRTKETRTEQKNRPFRRKQNYFINGTGLCESLFAFFHV